MGKVRHDWSMVKKYHDCKELEGLLESMPDNIVSGILRFAWSGTGNSNKGAYKGGHEHPLPAG